MLFLPPASFLRPSLLAAESLCFYPAEHPAKALILVEDPDVVNGVSSREVEQYQGEDHLLVRPPLGLPYVHMGADVISQAEDSGEVKVDGKAGEGGHVAVVLLFFVLVGKNALWHNGFRVELAVARQSPHGSGRALLGHPVLQARLCCPELFIWHGISWVWVTEIPAAAVQRHPT